MRKIPDDNLAYPIFLTWSTGSTGSGFRLRNDTTSYFITAKHVLYDDTKKLRGDTLTLLCQTKELNDDSTYLFNIDIKKLEANKMIFSHPKYDIATFIM